MSEIPPEGGGELSPDHYLHIAEVVGSFMAAWRAGLKPRKEDWLDKVPALARPELLRQLTALEGPAIPGYEIERELGRGSMGVVYKARQEVPNRVVALKLIHGGATADAELLARFKTEAEAAACLQHPNIAQIYEVGEHGGVPFFSLEYCGGGSLDTRLRHAPLPPGEAAALAEKLARAMHAAHEQGIVHRDLKPANVLLDADGTPKITDFGLAKKLGEAGQSATGAVLGTPSYMAPEQAEGRIADIGPRTDVYALGATLYECVTGRPPFRGANTLDTVLQVRTEETVPLSQLQPNLPPDLETICLKCLEKNPAKRYASAEALANDLRRFLDGKPIRARRRPAWERAYRWGRRNPRGAFAAAIGTLVLVAVVVVFAVYAWQQGKVADEVRQRLAAEAEKRRVADEAFTRELIRAGDTAAQLGAPEEARNKYSEALDRPDLPPDTKPLLHARIARMSAALDDMAAVKKELDALEQERNLPADVAALYRFEKALYLLHRSMESSFSSLAALTAETNPHEQEAEALLRQAVDDKALPEADRLTARGLLARSADEAMKNFREATDAEPFHPYANLYYASTALIAGRVEEALPRLEIWLRMSPRNPAPVLFKTVALTLLGKHTDADQVMQELEGGRDSRRPIGAGALAAYKGVLEMLRVIETVMVETPMDTKALIGLLGRLIEINQRPRPAVAPGEEVTGVFRVPLTPAQRRSVGQFLLAIQTGTGMPLTGAFSFPDARGALKQLEDVGPFVPEGLRLYFCAVFKANLNDEEGAVKDLERAAELPAIFPIRRFCLWMVASHKIKLASKSPAPETLRAEARLLLHRAYELGPMNAQLKEKYLDLLIQSGALDFAGDLARSWDNPKELKRIEQLKRPRSPE